MMTRLLLTTFLVILTVPLSAANGIEWKTTTESIKPSPEAESHTFPFQFRNHTDQPVRVVAALPTCECTTTHFDPAPVLPGETGIITATLHFEHRTGQIQKGVTVYFDRDPSQAHQLTIRAELPQYYTIEPATLTWPIKDEQRVRLTFSGIDPGRVSLEELPPAYPVQARLQKIAGQPATYDFFLRPSPEAPLNLESSITLQIATEATLPRLRNLPITIQPK